MSVALGDATANTVNVDSSGNIVVSSNITGSNKSLTVSAASTGDLRLSGTNSWDGGTNITGGSGGGRLRVDAVAALPTTGTIAISTGGRMTLNVSGTYGSSPQALTFNPNQTANPSLDIVSGAAVIWQGTVAINADTRIESNGGTGSLSFSGNASGSGTLIKQAAGNLTLSGTGNSLTGATQIGNGTLTVSSGSSMGTGALTFAQTSTNATTIVLNNATQTVGSLSSTWAATTGTIAQTLTLNGTALTVNQTADGIFGSGAVSTLTSSIGGTGSLIKSGSAKLTLATGNTYTGKTTINNGLIAASGESAFGNNPGSFVPDQIILNGGGIQATGNVNFSSNRGITLGAGAGTFDTNGNTITLSTVITGPGGLTKAGGAGTLVADAVHTYTGDTNVNVGTLQMNSGKSLAGKALIASGATLTGAGTITGGVSNHGTWQIGLAGSAGSFVSGGNVTSDNILSFDIFSRTAGANPASAADVLKFSGGSSNTVSLTGTLNVTDTTGNATAWAAGDIWTLLDWTSLGSVPLASRSVSFTTFNLPSLSAGLAWDTSALASAGTISVVTVPEPGRIMLAFIAVAGVMTRRRRA
jgi:autotransporter-associated beta strand protein